MEQHEMSTMKHLVYGEFGEPDVLTVAETAVPEPGPEEVLVRVRAAGLNPIDWKTRRGLGFAALQIRDHLPWTPGYDLAGEVVAVGEKVATCRASPWAPTTATARPGATCGPAASTRRCRTARAMASA